MRDARQITTRLVRLAGEMLAGGSQDSNRSVGGVEP